jgi:hypothetical protein
MGTNDHSLQQILPWLGGLPLYIEITNDVLKTFKGLTASK